jgi:hypothetical protein
MVAVFIASVTELPATLFGERSQPQYIDAKVEISGTAIPDLSLQG